MTDSNSKQEWFEMSDIRRRSLTTAVWVPLRAAEWVSESGEKNKPGHTTEYFGCGCVAIPLDLKDEAAKLGWQDIGIGHSGGPYAFSDGSYKPCENYRWNDKDDIGVDLVFEQSFPGAEPNIWHINQDLILALRLRKDGNVWVRPEEGYIEVIRERVDTDGEVCAIEIRSEFLRDYLAARQMALRLSTYRERAAILDDASYLDWHEKGLREDKQEDRFEAHVHEVDNDGGPFGGGVAVFQVWRTDVDEGEDVPVFDQEDDTNTAGRSKTFTRTGNKSFRAKGALWRNEWIEPAPISQRVRGDQPDETMSYVVDAAGARMSHRELLEEDKGRYLWFAPQVINTLLDIRGSGLKWHTRDTASVWCSPGDTVHFGVNGLGLVTVYAYDVSQLDLWQQRPWAGANISPDGKVSAELLSAQMKTRPANTAAPEAEFSRVLDDLDDLFQARFEQPLFRQHQDVEHIKRHVHRFRSVDNKSLLALAKDVTRLTTDRIDTKVLLNIVTPPKKETWGSLKYLQNALATILPDDAAYTTLSPLFGAYELRVGDAHLPSSKINDALDVIGIDRSANYNTQGCQLLEKVAQSLRDIHDAFRGEWTESG
jgi:hypothetical protein